MLFNAVSHVVHIRERERGRERERERERETDRQTDRQSPIITETQKTTIHFRYQASSSTFSRVKPKNFKQ